MRSSILSCCLLVSITTAGVGAAEPSWLGQPIDLAGSGFTKLGDGPWKLSASADDPQVLRLAGRKPIRYRIDDGPWQDYSEPVLCTTAVSVAAKGPSGVTGWHQSLAPGESLGCGLWARKLLNPKAAVRSALGINGLIESAEWNKGKRHLLLRQWQGDNQAGGREWGGNVVQLPGGVWWPIAIDGYRIEHVRAGRDNSLQWIQDAHVRLIYFAMPADQLVLKHGDTLRLDKPFPADALMVSIGVRHPGWNSSTWVEWAYTVGNLHYGSAVWQIAKGTSFYDAQKDARNRLASLDHLAYLSPEHGDPQITLQVQKGGHWQVLLDVGKDGMPDIVYGDHLAGQETCAFKNIAGQSGLVIVGSCAGGFKPGNVGETRIRCHIDNPRDTIDVRLIDGPTHARAKQSVAKVAERKAKQQESAAKRKQRLSEKNVKKLEKEIASLKRQLGKQSRAVEEARRDERRKLEGKIRDLGAQRANLEQEVQQLKQALKRALGHDGKTTADPVPPKASPTDKKSTPPVLPPGGGADGF